MTLQAVLPQLSPMFVLVAGNAVARQAQERTIQIFHLDCGALCFSNVFRFVTLLASEFGVLPFESVARSLVVKSLLREAPVNKREVLPVMLGMTANAVFAGGGDAHN
jgi:hypothetical protein